MRARLPKEWVVLPLGNVVIDILSGGTPSTKRPDYWSGTIPWITSKWLGEPLRISSGERFISASALADSASNVVPAGNLIYATRVGVGKVAVNQLDLAINQDLAGLVVDQSKAVPEFLAYQLRTNRVKSFVDGNKRGATIQGITRSCVREIELALPPLAEQRQIAAVLSAVQRSIEQQDRLITLTAELKNALTQKLFTEGTRGEPLKQTEIGPVPESWTVEPLGRLLSREPSNGLYRPQSDYGRGTLILRIDDFSNDGDVVTTVSNRVDAVEGDCQRFGLAQGDIVLNRVNSLSHLGKTALIGRLAEPMLFESNMMRFRVDEKRIRPAFAFRVLNSALCKSQVVGMAKRAVAQSSVNQGDVGRLLIPLPPDIETQDEMLAILDALEAKSTVHIQTRSSLTNLFRTLLNQLMTAQVRVDDLGVSALEAEVSAQPAGAV